MSSRVQENVERGRIVRIRIDGETVAGFEGETVAATMLAARISRFRTDSRGVARGAFCNMGTCSECFVTLFGAEGQSRRIRACLTPIADGMTIGTAMGETGAEPAHG